MTCKNKKHLLPVALVLALILLFGCKNKELKPAEVSIADPDRHYYPVIQGEILNIDYEIENISDETLVIKEIQTSCGCIIPADDLPILVLPNKKNRVKLAYNTIKNMGHVEHQIYLYGNFTDSIYRQLNFDTNVVPAADYIRDYEELWQVQEDKYGGTSVKDLVDGNSSQKGYYTDEKGDSRERTRRERQQKADEYAW